MDTIANLFSSIENAFRRRHSYCDVPFSRQSFSILHILVNEGYIAQYEEQKIFQPRSLRIVPKRIIRIFFKYKNIQQDLLDSQNLPSLSNKELHKMEQVWTLKTLRELKRVSRCGRRVYISSSHLWNKKFHGIRTYILSTPKGIMSDQKARTLNIGGEIIGYVM